MNIESTNAFWPAIKRGIACRCPKCGKGKLYVSYLKQVDHCSECNQDFANIRPEDGPAWLTIIIVGHIMAPVIPAMVRGDEPPQLWLIGVLLAVITLMTLALLPFTKGFFIAMLWRHKNAG